MDVLIASGANKQARNTWGRTPLQQAVYVPHNRYKFGKAYFELQEGKK